MPKDSKEPQSYGSQGDWVSGRTGQEVNEQDGAPEPEHRDFYDERRESETNTSYEGGRISDNHREGEPAITAPARAGDAPVSKVTAVEGGARRGGFFKKRDYE